LNEVLFLSKIDFNTLHKTQKNLHTLRNKLPKQ
jgi:hypothetical protein